MINMFVVKKYAALIFSPLLTVLLFYIALVYYDFWYGLGFMFVGIILGSLIGVILLVNPFTKMLEGKGILTLNIDSTGVIRPFIVGVRPPYIEGKIKSTKVQDVFNRDAVYNLSPPQKNAQKAEVKATGGITINLDEIDYNKGRFGLFHYPVLIYNEQLGSILTKDFFSETEKSSFAEHAVLYLNKKMQELTSAVRDFGRYVVEMTKPTTPWYKQKWIIIVVIVLIILLIALFAPAIIGSIQKSAGNFGGGLDTITSTVSPR